MIRKKIIRRATNKGLRAAINNQDGRDLSLAANWVKFVSI